MADTDPEDEGDDKDTPADRAIKPDHAHSHRSGRAKSGQKDQQEQKGRDKEQPPQFGRKPLQMLGDIVGDVGIRLISDYQGFARRLGAPKRPVAFVVVWETCEITIIHAWTLSSERMRQKKVRYKSVRVPIRA